LAEIEARNRTIEYIVTTLRSAGATVQTTTQNILVNRERSNWKEGKVLKINGYDMKVFEYKDDQAAAEAITKGTLLDSASEHVANLTTSRSHIYRAANIVAQYLGNDLATITLLESLFGKETSAAVMSSSKDVEVEAARLEKELEERERKQREST
jgi:hypothetical protein